MLHFWDLLEETDIDDVIEKMKKGRKEKGGRFDLESIPALAEAGDEVKDLIGYVWFHYEQRDH